MFVNILILIALAALVILFAWLTVRAVRAKRLWIKIVGFIGAMVAENLTSGGKLAGYSDGELFRTLRHSVNQQGHSLGFMSFLPYA